MDEFFGRMNLAPSKRGDAGDEMLQKIFARNAIDYLLPVATLASRSGKRRTAVIRAVDMIRGIMTTSIKTSLSW
jgi:hypothetical protein